LKMLMMSPGRVLPSESGHDWLLAGLAKRAFSTPDDVAYVFVDDSGEFETPVSCGALYARAQAVAHSLLREGVEPGQPVLLLFMPGLAYVEALLGVLYAGAVAVPAYPPRNSRQTHRIDVIVADACAAAVLTLSSWRQRLADSEALSSGRVQCIAIDELPTPTVLETLHVPSAHSELAVLQYTSGSTGQPKGVMLSHGNLMHNVSAMARVMKALPGTTGVSWLPPYHDMGLMGGLMVPLLSGLTGIVMSPAVFAQRPVRWLEAISKHRSIVSGGPNFGYDLCVDKITDAQMEGLDLSCWDLALNGAETVRAGTFQRFAERFSRWGFKGEAFYPCYGLAEGTLLVTGGHWQGLAQAQATHDADLSLPVSVGHSLHDQHVLVVDPQTRRVCAPGVEGEVWVHGPSVALGYWQRPAATAEVFEAELAQAVEGLPSRPYLRTGDLGHFQPNAQLVGGLDLFITGRIKDMIILYGRKFYPQDIELCAQRVHPALRKASGAAFAVNEDGRERLVLVQEMEPRFKGSVEEVLMAVRQAVAVELDATLDDICLVKAGSVDKTSSGKVRRNRVKQAYLEKTLEVLGSSQRSVAALPVESSDEAAVDGDLTQRITRIVAKALGLDALPPELSFFALGADSIDLMRASHALEEAFGQRPPLSQLFEIATVSALVAHYEPLTRQTLAQAAGQPLVASAQALTGLGEQALAVWPRMEPLSAAQQHLWLHEQMHEGQGLYNEMAVLSLKGPWVAGALKAAFKALTTRHESLRSTLVLQGASPMLCVQSPGSVPEADLPWFDSEGLSDALVKQAIQAWCHRPFDLAAGPLWRAGLWQRGPQEAWLVFNAHHLICDGWSLGVMWQEVAQHHAALLSGQAMLAMPVARQWGEMARAQRLEADEHRAQNRRHWRERLMGPLPVLDLPLDHPRPARRTARGHVVPFQVPGELLLGLRALAAQHQVTLYVVLMTAYQVLLSRLSGQAEVCVGTPVVGRDRAEWAGVIGYGVQTLTLRSDFSDAPSFATALHQVRRDFLAAHEHRHLPLDEVIDVAEAERASGHSPLFQTLFVLQNTPGLNGGLPGALALASDALGLKSSRVWVAASTAKLDLALEMVDDGAALHGQWLASADLFEPSTIERWSAHWRHLLQAVVQAPHTAVLGLPLLDEAQAHVVLHGLNPGSLPTLRHTTVVHALAEQVSLRPGALALVGPSCLRGERVAASSGAEAVEAPEGHDISLTYAELDAQSTRWAQVLRAQGVRKGDLVGLLVQRSVEMLVAIWAVWKVGAAHVPMDPAYPPERLRAMLADAPIKALLSTRADLHGSQVWLGASAGEVAGSPLTLRLEDMSCLAWSAEALALPDTSDLAYVIFTSGSTGRPKGVMVEHRGMAHLIQTQQAVLQVDASHRVLQLASLSFDSSIWEILLAHAHGGSLHVVSQGTLMSAPALAAQIQTQGITTATLPPSLLALMPPQPLSRVHTLIVAGESCPTELARCWSEGRRFFNGYGPTENTVCATLHEVTPAERGQRPMPPPPIGKPAPHAHVRVLDEYLQPVPIGVSGELFVGGGSLARGYLGQPDLTAQRFVADPFLPDGRLYRTGDRVRWRADGALDFLGRLDQQVKLRGFRIELGDIEAALLAQSGVREAVVLLHIDEGEHAADPMLVAYVGCEAQRGLSDVALRQALQQRLPAYMVPAMVIVMAALPWTPNGKIDRKALPKPAALSVQVGEHLAPRDALELSVMQMWEEVLGRSGFGITDRFFDIGGHSLAAIRIVGEIEKRHGVAVSVSTLMQEPTIEAVAVAIRKGAPRGAPQVMVPIRPQGERTPIFFVHAAGGTVMCYHELARHMAPGRPVYGLQALGIEEGAEPVGDLITMASHYVASILQVQPEGPYLLAGWSVGGNIVFEMARQLLALGHEVPFIGMLDASAATFGEHAPARDDVGILVELFSGEMALDAELLRQLPADHLMEQAVQLAQERRWYPPGFSITQARRLLNVFRMAEQAVRGYGPRVLNTGATGITVFRSTEPAPSGHVEVADRHWARWVDGPVRIVDAPGHHLNMVMAPHSTTLGRLIDEAIAPW
jgi:amino acid adenylation domain-containing protein